MILRQIGEDHVGPNASTYIPEPGLTTDKAPSPSLTGVCDSTTWSEAKSPVRLKSDLYTVLFPHRLRYTDAELFDPRSRPVN